MCVCTRIYLYLSRARRKGVNVRPVCFFIYLFFSWLFLWECIALFAFMRAMPRRVFFFSPQVSLYVAIQTDMLLCGGKANFYLHRLWRRRRGDSAEKSADHRAPRYPRRKIKVRKIVRLCIVRRQQWKRINYRPSHPLFVWPPRRRRLADNVAR